MVNNAAAFVFGTVEQATEQDWDKVLGVNVKGSTPHPGVPSYAPRSLTYTVMCHTLKGMAFCAKYVVKQISSKKVARAQ